jgi:hypothetical protein
MASNVSNDVLADEVALLQAMYPDEISYDGKASELNFKHESSSLTLRTSGEYPTNSLPDLLEATGPGKCDLRAKVNSIIAKQRVGESCMDAIITSFIDLTSSLSIDNEEFKSAKQPQTESGGSKTVIIWLHHLLATGKRKQALSPEGQAASRISGITKLGYPGVMIFSGPVEAVDAHVQALKHLRWQAFQVRCETEDVWSFAHGVGFVEVETMAQVVAEIEQKSAQKDLFMEAMKIK